MNKVKGKTKSIPCVSGFPLQYWIEKGRGPRGPKPDIVANHFQKKYWGNTWQRGSLWLDKQQTIHYKITLTIQLHSSDTLCLTSSKTNSLKTVNLT